MCVYVCERGGVGLRKGGVIGLATYVHPLCRGTMHRAVSILLLTSLVLLLTYSTEGMPRSSGTSRIGYPRPCYCERGCSGNELMRTQWFHHNGTTMAEHHPNDNLTIPGPAIPVTDSVSDQADECDSPTVTRSARSRHERVDINEYKCDSSMADAAPMNDDAQAASHPSDSLEQFHDQLYPCDFESTPTSSGAASYLLLLLQVTRTHKKKIVTT
jgi:hypothetical protein